jgi:hypothetical protein
MTPPNKRQSVTPRNEPDPNEYYYRFDPLIERFHISGDVQILKNFIRLGGDIRRYKGLAETVADLIGVSPEPNPGGGKAADMINFYIEVELIRKAPRQRNRNKTKPTEARPRKPTKAPTLTEQLAGLKKKTSRTDAIVELAEKYGLSFDGGEYRYKKGEKLFIERFGKRWN